MPNPEQKPDINPPKFIKVEIPGKCISIKVMPLFYIAKDGKHYPTRQAMQQADEFWALTHGLVKSTKNNLIKPPVF